MSDPIDIKTKKINSKIYPKFKDLIKKTVHEALEKNIISHWDTWGKISTSMDKSSLTKLLKILINI